MKSLFVPVLLALVISVDGKLNFMKKTKCKNTDITCKCGANMTNVTVEIHQCSVKNPVTGVKTCEPCNKDLLQKNPCDKLRHCEECMNRIMKCTTCPPGRSGNRCYRDDPKPILPLKIRIPRGGTVFQKHRKTRESTTCRLPDNPMKTNEIDCVIYPEGVNCTQKCVYGHTFEEGQTRQLHCNDEENVWVPHQFEECEPYAACTQIKLQEPGKVYCVSHMMNKKSWCEVQCFAFENHKRTNWQRSECNLDSTWTPRLPFCAKPDESTSLVSPPASKQRQKS